MCRSKCLTARLFVLGKGSSLILETEDSWEVLKESLSLPPHWGARINWGNRQVVIENDRMLSSLSPSAPWCVERGPFAGLHLLVEAEKVWGLFRASS